MGSQAIVAVTNNKQEFDTRKDKWLIEIRGIIHEPNSPSTSVTQPNARSHCSTLSSCFKSKRSSTSSKLSFKCLQAEAKLKVAQLESLHLKERAEEKRKRELLIMESEQREAHRKIELTKIELQVYNEAYENTSGQTKHTASALECSKMDRPQSMADIKERGPCVLSPPTTFATQSLPAVKTSGKSHFNQSALDTQMRLMEDQSNLAQFAGSSKEYEQARGSQFGQPLDIAQVADIVQEPPPVLLPDSACKYNSPLNCALGQPSFQPVTLPHVFESNCNVSLDLAPPRGSSLGSDLAQGPSCAPLSQSSRKYNSNLALAQGQSSSQNPDALQMPKSAQGPQLTLPTAPGSCLVSNLAQGLPFAQLPDYSRESNPWTQHTVSKLSKQVVLFKSLARSKVHHCCKPFVLLKCSILQQVLPKV